MKIGVVSDTHSREIPKQLLEDFKKVDLILHAGDFCSLKDLEKFKKLKTVDGVQGNMDDPDIRKLFPVKKILTFGKISIGLFHGEGPPKTILERVKEQFVHDQVDCVIFGHSHIALNQKEGNVLYFNPGSPNDSITAPACCYGILDLAPSGISGQIITVKNG